MIAWLMVCFLISDARSSTCECLPGGKEFEFVCRKTNQTVNASVNTSLCLDASFEANISAVCETNDTLWIVKLCDAKSTCECLPTGVCRKTNQTTSSCLNASFEANISAVCETNDTLQVVKLCNSNGLCNSAWSCGPGAGILAILGLCLCGVFLAMVSRKRVK